MKAGKLRHSVTIQSATETQSNSGVITQTWGTHATVHARISPTGGREGWQGDVPDGGRMIDVEIRALSTVTRKMRILYGSRVLYIKEVIDPNERGINMILKCEESTD